MSDVFELIKTRRSVRKFKSEMPSKELIDQVVEAGLYAASGMDRQGVITLVITQKELRDKLSAANAKIMGKEDFDPFYGAPCVLVVLANKEYPTYLYDGSLVMGNLMFAAHASGLGSCWIHRAKEEFEQETYQTLLKDLGIEGNWEGIGHCVIGYADQEPAGHPRKENRVYHID